MSKSKANNVLRRSNGSRAAQEEAAMTPSQKKWLASVLATQPGGRHKDLGRFRTQGFHVGMIAPLPAIPGYPGVPGSPCDICGKRSTAKGHDPGMANLPGVVNACCGHGLNRPHATLSNFFCLRGKALRIYLEKVGRLERFYALCGPNAERRTGER